MKAAAKATGPPAPRCHVAKLPSAIIAIHGRAVQAEVGFVSGGSGSHGCMCSGSQADAVPRMTVGSTQISFTVGRMSGNRVLRGRSPPEIAQPLLHR